MTSFNDCKISFRLLRENKHPSDSFNTDINGHESFKALAFHPKYDNIMITDEKIDGTTTTWKNQNQDAKNDESLNDVSKYCLLFVKFKFAENEDGIESERWMAISHGEGHKLLDIDALEYGFGLHTAFCLIDHEKIMNIETRTNGLKRAYFRGKNSAVRKDDEIRMNETDLIIKIEGEPLKNDDNKDCVATYISATNDFLNVQFKNSIQLENLTFLCQKYFQIFKSRNYESFVNYVPMFDKQHLPNLDKRLAEKIKMFNKNSEGLELIYPLMDPDFNMVKFTKKNNKNMSKIYEELNFKNFFEEISSSMDIQNSEDADILKLLTDYSINLCTRKGETKDVGSWSIKQCIFFYTSYFGYEFIYINGLWYRIKVDYIEFLEEKFEQKIVYKTMPDFNEQNLNQLYLNEDSELKYSRYVADTDKCLFLENIKSKIGSVNSSEKNIKFCDILRVTGSEEEDLKIDLIFTNTYANFKNENFAFFNQSIFAAMILNDDSEARKNVYKSIKEKAGDKGQYYLKALQKVESDHSKLTFHFGIIVKRCEDRSLIPSLIIFNDTKTKIESLGYNIAFEWIYKIDSN